MFQFLIGTLKTSLTSLLICWPGIVSIPHRYAENEVFVQVVRYTPLVSIPHRYAENTALHPFYHRGCSFQFLIGTLKTWVDPADPWQWRGFQFLIGTLKTRKKKGNAQTVYYVSIPHRYAENLFVINTDDFLCRFSIPHRYAENLGGTMNRSKSGRVSIPHRYAENLEPGQFMRRLSQVSIPHRYAENLANAKMTLPALEGFNSS